MRRSFGARLANNRRITPIDKLKQKSLFLSIKNKKDITKVFDAGEKIYSKNILMRYIISESPREILPFYALMALPKKKLGAVGRNRLRRICKSALFQAMKKIIQNNHETPLNSYDLVFHVRENFTEVPESERIVEFETLVNRLFKMTKG